MCISNDNEDLEIKKFNRLSVSLDILARFSHNAKNFLHCFIIVDETWVNYYFPESKKHSKQLVFKSFRHQSRQKQFYQKERLWQLFEILMKLS